MPSKRYGRIGEFVKPFGLNWARVESVALVTELEATGSDPPPTSRRAVLIADMQTREVRNPNRILASPTTSLVLASAYLPPGVKKGRSTGYRSSYAFQIGNDQSTKGLADANPFKRVGGAGE